ncbi:type II toxin-antitoxin system mRNA interferase toxin, RelE/StbE family [Candidatus Microgenomates bacterium]|nr:type II toxin-antitoxin system mRNA interferase toxin, RelE/StbE family [Candidatus Microgenomates bacterium]
MVKIERTGKFNQLLDEIHYEDSALKAEIDKRIRWFRKNSQDTRLDNHPLTGRMKGKWAFSITDDIRIVYEWLGKTTVRFLGIGGHRKVYKRK